MLVGDKDQEALGKNEILSEFGFCREVRFISCRRFASFFLSLSVCPLSFVFVLAGCTIVECWWLVHEASSSNSLHVFCDDSTNEMCGKSTYG